MNSGTKFQERLAGFRADSQSSRSVTIQKALFVARFLQERGAELQRPSERRRRARLDRMLQNPRDKATLVLMTDQAFRSSRPRRAVEQQTREVIELLEQPYSAFYSQDEPWAVQELSATCASEQVPMPDLGSE